MDNKIAMWNGFSEFREHRGSVACKQFCLPGWLRCLVVASDRPRVIKLDNAVSNMGAQGLTESGEPGLVCEQWWNQVQASIFGELIIQSSSTRSERNLEEGRAERLGLAQWCQGKRKNIVQLSILLLHGILPESALPLFFCFPTVTMNSCGSTHPSCLITQGAKRRCF